MWGMTGWLRFLKCDYSDLSALLTACQVAHLCAEDNYSMIKVMMLQSGGRVQFG